LVFENGFNQIIERPTRWDSILDVYLIRPEISCTTNSIVQGIGDYRGVILEVDWERNFRKTQPDRAIPVYSKADVLGLRNFLRDRYADWASKGNCVEQIWYNFRSIVHESVECFIPHNILKINSDPEYYNKDIKRLKSKFRKVYKKRKLGVHYMDKLKHLSKQLLAEKKRIQETYLKSILSKECKCWSDFYTYVKRRKGSRENIPGIKDGSGGLSQFRQKRLTY